MSKNKHSSSSLLIISAAPARIHDSKFFLDKKFVEGMRLYARNWIGRVGCLLPESLTDQPFGDLFDPDLLPFEVKVYRRKNYITADELKDYDIILCSGDNEEFLHISDICRREKKVILFTIENTPKTRRQIVMLERKRPLIRKLKSIFHIYYQERRRRNAFALAHGLQANGYPALEKYREINTNILLYFDNRIDANLLATEDEMAARRDHLALGGRLRLLHSGRLESLKGSQDLIPIACRLRDQGVNFSLDIFGSGSLESEIRLGIIRHELQELVRLHGIVDFATVLVPFARKNADVYLSCHRQSDPSCSYLENMGCGLAVAGYSNQMWKSLARESRAGWVAPLGNWEALADCIVAAADEPSSIIDRCHYARNFTKSHLFEEEFVNRLNHLRNTASIRQVEESGG